MSSWARFGLSLMLALLPAWSAAVTVLGTDMTLNGNALVSGSSVQLTAAANNQTGSAWRTTPVSTSTSFTSTFSFSITGTPTHADGISFAMQNVGSTALGYGGGSIGVNGISNQVNLSIQTFVNNRFGFGNNTIGTKAAPNSMGSCSSVAGTVTVGYDLATTTLTLSGSYVACGSTYTVSDTMVLNLATKFGSTMYVGFTGATGGAVATQTITSWTFSTPVVAWRPVSGTPSSNYGSPYVIGNTYNGTDLSGTYTSGTTPIATVEAFTTTGTQGAWFGVMSLSSGNIVFDMGQTLAMDRVLLFWTNSGSTNNISCLSVDVSTTSTFSTFTTVATHSKPVSVMSSKVMFSQQVSGRYVRLRWACIEGSYPGLNEIVIGGALNLPPQVDHVEVTASSNTGVTCAPTTYTVKACSDASCATPYTGGLTGTLTLTGAGVTANFPSGAAFSIASGSSTATVVGQVTTPSTATVGVTGLSLTPANATPVWCGLGATAASGGSCAMTVGSAGFLVSVPNHYAGGSQTVSIKAVRSSDNAQVCIPAFASVTRTVKAICSYVNPASGTVPVQLGAVKLNSGNTNSACDATGQNVNLAFDANGATSTTLSYWDAGKARLSLAYSGSAGNNDAGLSLNGTADFVAAPMGFIVTDYPSVATAGNSFSFNIKALAWGSNTNVLPNFGQESPREAVVLDWVRSEPTGAGAQAGSFTGSVGLFSGGVAAVSDASWSEVGRISPTVRLASGSYLSSGRNSAGNPMGIMGWTHCASEAGGSANPCVLPSGITASVYFGVGAKAYVRTGQSGTVACSNANFGDPASGFAKACYYTPLAGAGSVTTHIQVRPARLEVSAAAACGSFSYAGQPFGVTVTAKNALNAVTQNYAGVVARTINFSDSSANTNGSLSGSVPASAFNLGVATLANTAATAPVFSFSNKLTAPQTIGLRATDTDGVSSTGYDGSQTLRSGRLQMSNAFGGDKTSLQIPLQLQYWSGKSWVKNSDDTCTVIATASVVRAQTLNHNNSAATWSSAISSVSLSGGSGFITLGTPSPSGTGTVDLSINLGATSTDVSCLATHPNSTGAGIPWLRSRQGNCASTFDRDPSARGTFGVYSPETKRSVHVREVF